MTWILNLLQDPPPREVGALVENASQAFAFAASVAGVLLLPALLAHVTWLRRYFPAREEIVTKNEFATWKEEHRKEQERILEKLLHTIREDMQGAVNRIGGQELANQAMTTAMLTEIKIDIREALGLSREAREQSTRNGDAIQHLKEVTDLRLERCEGELTLREKRRPGT